MSPISQRVASRADLNYLFEEMLGELTVGHMFVRRRRAARRSRRVKAGLLGADYTIENGRYRFAQSLQRRELESAASRAAHPARRQRARGRISAGGERPRRCCRPTISTASSRRPRASRWCCASGPNADGAGSRDVTVVPVENEDALRNLAWIEDNRRKVDRAERRPARLRLPAQYGRRPGYTNFNRYYFAQVGKEGAVIDERFNGGGDHRRLHHRLSAPAADRVSS